MIARSGFVVGDLAAFVQNIPKRAPDDGEGQCATDDKREGKQGYFGHRFRSHSGIEQITHQIWAKR
jgi:hypothetical protein